MKNSETLAIQGLLVNALSNEPIFKVLKLKQVTEIFNELAFKAMTPCS